MPRSFRFANTSAIFSEGSSLPAIPTTFKVLASTSYQRELDVMTVTGRTLGENLKDLEENGFFTRYLGYLANYNLTRYEAIFPLDKAEELGSIAVLKGNIAV